jgi:hypothetical protein
VRESSEVRGRETERRVRRREGGLFPPRISYRSTAGSHCMQWLEDISLLRVVVRYKDPADWLWCQVDPSMVFWVPTTLNKQKGGGRDGE